MRVVLPICFEQYVERKVNKVIAFLVVVPYIHKYFRDVRYLYQCFPA